ncbi:RNA polymerase sigma-D factor [subsurface metagenome]
MWEHYYWLAYRCAVKAKGGMGQDRGVTVGDLCQWAGLGLKDAIEKFDLGRKVRFETYAWGRMRGAVADGLRDWDVLSRAGRREARREPGGRADRLGSARRFSDVVGADGEGTEPRNQVGVAGVGSGLDRSDEWAWLMRELSRRDRLILALYFREGLTMKEIGVVVGRTESLMSQAVCASKGLIRERVEGRSNGG